MSNTHLQQATWQIVATIPAGKVVSYGQAAKLAGYPTYSRHIGKILKELPSGTQLPWHRVINSQGRLSFPIGSEPYLRQKALLESEGIIFHDGKINLTRFQWSPE